MAYKKPMPTIRPTQEARIKYALEQVLDARRVNFPYRNCLNCKNWNFEMDGCNKFQSKPPTEVIVYSCGDHYEDNDDIPF